MSKTKRYLADMLGEGADLTDPRALEALKRKEQENGKD